MARGGEISVTHRVGTLCDELLKSENIDFGTDRNIIDHPVLHIPDKEILILRCEVT